MSKKLTQLYLKQINFWKLDFFRLYETFLHLSISLFTNNWTSTETRWTKIIFSVQIKNVNTHQFTKWKRLQTNFSNSSNQLQTWIAVNLYINASSVCTLWIYLKSLNPVWVLVLKLACELWNLVVYCPKFSE